jgi:hypothetical protein
MPSGFLASAFLYEGLFAEKPMDSGRIPWDQAIIAL